MPNPATDRQRLRLIAIAIMSVAMAAFALRVITRASTTASRPLPTADVQSLTAYLGPLTDSSRLAEIGPGAMVGDRDPFGFVPTSAQTGTPGSVDAVSRPAARTGEWIVSSILFEDSRRSAIVNNAWVTVGDPLGGGARVTAIERKHVVVTDANGIRHVVPIRDGAL